jgi:hypothetical protein
MTNLETALAAIKAGTMSLYSAKQLMGASITESEKQALTAAHDAVMSDVCNHQDRMDRVMRRSY